MQREYAATGRVVVLFQIDVADLEAVLHRMW
jgi:hypothetical protein